jgi:hypothetical protein
MVDKEELDLQVAACCDTLIEAVDELAERDVPNPRGRVIGRAFELWLADPKAQDWQRSKYELQQQAQQLLREMEKQRKRKERRKDNDDTTDTEV